MRKTKQQPPVPKTQGQGDDYLKGAGNAKLPDEKPPVPDDATTIKWSGDGKDPTC